MVGTLSTDVFNDTQRSNGKRTRLPQRLVLAILLVSLLPLGLNVLGFDFTSSSHAPVPTSDFAEGAYQFLRGSFVHTILEWSAFCTAIFTVVLAFAYFNIQHDVMTPIIGVTLLCAGSMDAFHTLAADRLLVFGLENPNLIPFTWVLCRMCNALLTILGVSLFIVGQPHRWARRTSFVVGVSILFGLMSYGIIYLCATRNSLPATVFPHSIVTRPWDVIPLILFIIAGVFIYPRFYHRYPSLFSHALIVSTIPNAATQLHMAFGSTALFDNHFNIAHFLKIVAYLVPLMGLILDYTDTHQVMRRTNRQLSREIEERRQIQQCLQESEGKEREKSQQLELALHRLQQTQAHLVQSEKMSSLGQLVAGVAHEINNPVNFIYGNLTHASQYTQDLLGLVELYQRHYPTPVPAIQAEADAIDLDFIVDDLPRLLSSMKVGADRIQKIVASLRTFSRMDEADLKAVNIHEGIDSTLMILQNRLKAKSDRPAIEVIRNYGSLPLVECYAGQLNQVFMNILVNAADALDMRDQGRSYTEMQQSPSEIRITTTLIERMVWIQIKDNGPGMPEVVQQRIFDPFFTTKPVGKGTGMGLSISYQIVTEKHGGEITCFSQPDQGTEFTIKIPLERCAVSVRV